MDKGVGQARYGGKTRHGAQKGREEGKTVLYWACNNRGLEPGGDSESPLEDVEKGVCGGGGGGG